MQSAIHEGYEYQDYFTVSIILQLMLCQTDAEIIIDRKEFTRDKFDDLKVKTSYEITEFQIKYSDDKTSHKLTKDDFSNGNGHDTALSDLFASWKNRRISEKDAKVKLCLAWDRPTIDDPITNFLRPIQEQFLPFSTITFVFDGNLFWPEEGLPPKTWRKFNSAIKAGLIDRESFLTFCNELSISLEMPKASLDLKNPGAIEKVIMMQAGKLGIGIFPNDNLNIEDVIYKLATEVKHSRAMGNSLYTSTLINRLGLIIDYGKFDQRFPVDSVHQIILDDEIERLHGTIQDKKHVIITGNPGSGKSWFVDEYIDKLQNRGSKVIHYNCFHSLQDTYGLDRIRITSLYGNLVSQIMENFPKLVEYKNTIFGADKEELENLLQLIEEDCYLIVDGLDHIDREYELHKDFIAKSETEIISEFLEIKFPTNCYVIVSSQPIDAIEKFMNGGYFAFEIEPWGKEQAKSLMVTYQIEDNVVDDDNTLHISEYLVEKSQGNALYLSYILRQLQNLEISKEMIEQIPDYDTSLFNYYSYLYAKIHNNRTVYALCGADFYLSIDDLMEITGDGEYVNQDISVLHPLLVENILSGGFSIYHESFRRFVLSLLKEKKVDVAKNVYGTLAEWLQMKPFFQFDKSFYYLPELLYKVKRDDDNIMLIETEFVLKSVAEGYSRKSIRKNLNYIIRSAGRNKNLEALVTAGELLAMLDDLNEFESTGEEYLQAICDIKGATKINQLMQIDGKPTFDDATGKIACYISSKAGVKPWWELYLDTDAKQYNIEEFKYYFRYNIDNQGIGVIPQYMAGIEKEDISIRNQCIEIAYNELVDYIGYDEIVSIAEEQELTHWNSYLSYIETGYYIQCEPSTETVLENWDKIKKIEMPGKDISIFKELFSQIYFLVKKGNNKAYESIISECQNINWFYNWIIYSVRMSKLCAYVAQLDAQSVCSKTISNLELLLQDTDVFKGKPRTCDLYYLQKELTKSYEKALELIVKNGTLQDLDKALSILEQLDIETGTSLDHSMGGPLTDAEFLGLMGRFLTVENYEAVKPYLIRTQGRIEQNEVYDCIAAAKLRFASLISKYNKVEALEYFNLCTRYLVAYGFHKDIILEQIMKSYNIYWKCIEGNSKEERDTITRMTLALWNHTDGRETKHFFNKWFDMLLETDSGHAIATLLGFEIHHGRSWVVENMLESVIKKYSADSRYLDIVIGLIESLPNDMNPRIIDAATSVFETLNQMSIVASEKESMLIKQRMGELVVNVLSRFNILDNPWPENDSWKDGSIKEFLLTVEAEKYDVSQYIEYFRMRDTDNLKNVETGEVENIRKEKKKSFNVSSVEEMRKWLETHDLQEWDIPHVCEFLKNYQDDNDTLLEMMKLITIETGRWGHSHKKKEILLQIIDSFNLNDKEMSQIHMLMYLYSYEWGSSLIDNEEFQKSTKLSLEVALTTFYSEAPEVIISRSGRITQGLIEAIFAAEYDKDIIIKIWRSVFDIMQLRFPNLDQIPIDFVMDETEEKTGLRNCLLMRFLDGGKESFLATYAYLANSAEEENYLEFTESIVSCLEHYKRYNLVTQIAIADLIRCYGSCLPNMCVDRMINAIDNVYPTGNLLLDVLFSNFTIYQKSFSIKSDKNAPDYMEQEDMEFYLSEQLYDLGKVEKREGNDDYAKHSIYRDSVMKIVSDCDIDYVKLYKKLHASKELNDQIRDFVSASCKIPEINTVYKAYVIQYAIHAIIEKAFQERKPELIPQNLLRLLPDYQGMYRLFKCRKIQPHNHLYEKKNSLEPFHYNNEDEYILVGSCETRKYIDHKQLSIIYAYQGIVRENDVENKTPFCQYLITEIDSGQKYLLEDYTGALINMYRTLDMELENENFLCPNILVSEVLNVHIGFDYLNGRYIAVNREGEIVFFMKKWQSSYNGDSDYPGYAIPLYTGTELYMKREYVQVLEQQFGKLMVKTCVDTYTQNY